MVLSANTFIASLAVAQVELLYVQVARIESGGRADAVGDGGKALGLLQIHKAVVDDVNRDYRTTFTHEDMLDPKLAKSVFTLYLALYATEKRLGRTVTNVDRALIWHSGPNGWQSPKSKRNSAYLSKLK